MSQAFFCQRFPQKTCIPFNAIVLFIYFSVLKRFLEDCYSREENIQSEIEQNFLEIEQRISSSKLQKKKKKLNSSQKKKNRLEHDVMVTLAAQLQVDHFRQVGQSI